MMGASHKIPPPGAGVAFAAKDVARFWALVEKTDNCWWWKGGRQKRPDGTPSYGIFCIGKRRILAHVFAWVSQNGPVPAGQVIRHACDNPPCVKYLGHLEPGTQAQNLADMRERGRAFYNRFPTGPAHPKAKIDEDKVRLVRNLRAEGLSLAKIGDRVGLHASTVHDIVHGKTWGHVA